MKIFKCLFVWVAVTFSPFASAAYCEQKHNQLGELVGVEGKDGVVYASLINSAPACSCAYVKFKPSNVDTDKALSVLLTAKMSGKAVRVDFLAHGQCNEGVRIYLQ